MEVPPRAGRPPGYRTPREELENICTGFLKQQSPLTQEHIRKDTDFVNLQQWEAESNSSQHAADPGRDKL